MKAELLLKVPRVVNMFGNEEPNERASMIKFYEEVDFIATLKRVDKHAFL